VKKTPTLLLLLFLSSMLTKATPRYYPAPEYSGVKKYGFSYAFSGAVSFFKVDQRESEKAVPRIGGGGIFRIEFYPSPSVHIQLGFELMTQACAFNTYYFAPGYSQLYDRSYGYTHTLRTLEMYVPILARIGLNPEESNQRTIFYFLGGYAPKVFLGASNTIVQNSNGKGVGGGSTELLYEHHFLGEQVGNVMIAGFGCDKRFGFVEKFMTFEIIYRYNLSRFSYDIGKNNGNLLLIKNSCLNLQIGYRFR
jgi:hypothetical protein